MSTPVIAPPSDPQCQDGAREHHLGAIARAVQVAGVDLAVWDDVLAAAQGATPADVAAALADHALPVPSQVRHAGLSQEVPELHLADREWYFTSDTARALAELVNLGCGRLACIGTPTVARSLAAKGQRPVLVDASATAEAHVNADGVDLFNCDARSLRDSSLEGAFEAAVFDAPWYLDDVLAWLSLSSQLVRRGGRIFFALFQPLTKPHALDERETVLAACEGIGEVTVMERSLTYETPRFEREAFLAAGVSAPRDWRRADLVEVDVARPFEAVIPPAGREIWETFVIGTQVVKLRRNIKRSQRNRRSNWVVGPVPGIKGLVVPSVSRSYHAWPRVDLWTSRNRVCRVGDRTLLRDWLDHLARGLDDHLFSRLALPAPRDLGQLLHLLDDDSVPA